jgi:acyl-CoA reductase-like NAD-dependent aldehyde dehydrogenase
MNAGQVCVAPSRVYVHESIADELIAGVKQEFERIERTLGSEPPGIWVIICATY